MTLGKIILGSLIAAGIMIVLPYAVLLVLILAIGV